ncbi:RING-H2_zinc finger-containing protein [Hexamita inflata]|uniref:RING-type E3 ubiquitin transferase n=1 Tax=Hexamita inflata TaxID=28002 RepID=A0AA86P780_9EUKA|nr:RING-H2 zinc finger-containing protein [Hexamita inflata]CAI9954958.1 RING-H2 zinc finger-containing protein [Hexamita inflata]
MYLFIYLLAFPEYQEVNYVHPLQASIQENYNQYWSFPNRTLVGIFSFFKQQSARSFAWFYDDTYKQALDQNKTRSVDNIIYMYTDNYTTSDIEPILFTGKYYPTVKRGIQTGIIPFRFKSPKFNLEEQSYIDQILDLNAPFPNITQSDITDEQIKKVQEKQISSDQCEFTSYFEISEQLREIKPNQYLPDYQMLHNESTPYNETHENVATTKSRIISQNCAADLVIEGPIFNNAQTIRQAFVYCIFQLISSSLSLLAGLRLLVLSNSPSRIEKMSLASFVMQTIFDFCMAVFQISFGMQVNQVFKQMALISTLLITAAIGIDSVLVAQCYSHYLRRIGRRNNPRNMCTMMCWMYAALFAYIFISPYIPDWGIFIIILAASSYWFMQSIYSFRKENSKKFLPLDYLVIQTIVKYAPVCYFYAWPKNFMQVMVLPWYKYCIGIWFGFQILLIFSQYFFGSRLCFNYVNQKQKPTYDYAEQNFKDTAISELESFVPNQQILVESAAKNMSPLQYLQQQNKTFIIPFVHQSEGLYMDPNPCQNPLHEHSAFYNKNIRPNELNAVLFKQQNIQQILQKIQSGDELKCFVFVDEEKADELFDCCICMDYIHLSQLKTTYPLCISKNEVEEGKLIKKGEEELWITPCGHTFHAKCLSRWGAENLQCPVDRRDLPAMTNEAWWE